MWGLIISLASLALVIQTRIALGSRENPSTAWVAQEIPGLDKSVQFGVRRHDYLASRDGGSSKVISELLIDAIIQVESQGNPLCVGKAGERGIMQVKRDTWNQMTRQLFGQRLPFDMAFDPNLNRQVGRAYLAEVQRIMQEYRDGWKADERSLLLACYNAGPNCVISAGFDVSRLPAQARDYVARVSALHDVYLAQNGVRLPDFAALPSPGQS